MVFFNSAAASSHTEVEEMYFSKIICFALVIGADKGMVTGQVSSTCDRDFNTEASGVA